jgi:cation diffusion facilitator family transporter
VTAPTTSLPRVVPASHRSVWVSLTVCLAETLALGLAAVVTGSAAITTQTVTSGADVVGGVLLVIGVVSSERPEDARHPLGYGRERFFWSFVAAVATFIGGVGAAVVETVRGFAHAGTVGSYPVGFAVLAVIVVLDSVALTVGLRPLLRSAALRNVPVRQLLWRGSDPAATTVVLSSAVGVLSSILAGAGLAARRVTGDAVADATASALIGVLLLASSVVLLHTSRELLTGRGLPASQVALMREVVGSQIGIIAVPDIFAIVVGPATLIVDVDIIFDDGLNVPAVEDIIVSAAKALRSRWPSVTYVYMNPVAARRPRRGAPARVTGAVSPAGHR